MNNQNTILAMLLSPDQSPQIQEIPRDLAEYQKRVGGNIECFGVTVRGAIGVCNEEFVFERSPINFKANVLRAEGVSIICGEVLIMGDDGQNFQSLTAVQIGAITEKFRVPMLEDLSIDYDELELCGFIPFD